MRRRWRRPRSASPKTRANSSFSSATVMISGRGGRVYYLDGSGRSASALPWPRWPDRTPGGLVLRRRAPGRGRDPSWNGLALHQEVRRLPEARPGAARLRHHPRPRRVNHGRTWGRSGPALPGAARPYPRPEFRPTHLRRVAVPLRPEHVTDAPPHRPLPRFLFAEARGSDVRREQHMVARGEQHRAILERLRRSAGLDLATAA